MFIFFTNFLFSQNGNVALTWDMEVGFQSYSYDDKKRISLEDISDSFCLRVCEYSQINYELIGETGAIQSVEWIVSGGNLVAPISDMTGNTIYWGESGNGTLQLLVFYTNGTSQTKTICIEKIHTPRADFFLLGNPPDNIVCKGQDVTFVNSSTPNEGSQIVSYSWSFGDGTFSNAFQPIHSYSFPGVYEVNLTVTNECNCQNKIRYYVTVKKLGVNITCANVACEGQKSTYSVSLAEMGGCVIQKEWWSVIGGEITGYANSNSEIEVLWNDVPDNGFGQILFDNTLCSLNCVSISSIEIPVIKINGKIVGEPNACGKTQYRYKLPQWPTTEFNWSLEDNDGTGATLVPTDQRNEVIINTDSPGDIILRCNYNNTLLNCGGSAFLKINIKSFTNINGVETICENTTSSYTVVDDNGNVFEGNWTLVGPGGINQTETTANFSTDFGMAGSYILSVEGNDFCNPQPKIITVSPTPPEPDSINGETQVCAGMPLTYAVNSPQFGYIYEWQVVSSTGATAAVFYGGNFGASVSLAFFPTFSSYIVKVRAKQIDSPYCTSAFTVLNVNKIIPNVAIVGENSICASTSAIYSTTYTDADEYIWSITPSVAGSVTQNPSNPTEISVLWNNYTGSDVPQVKLRVRKCNTYFEAPSVNINLLFSPEITLTAPTTICKGESFTVALNPIPNLTSFDHIDWDFGDGTVVTVYPTSSSFLTSPSHSYNLAISSNTDYDISAVVYGANGCIYPATGIHTITVLPTIQADISPAVGLYACSEEDITALFNVNIQEGIGNTTLIEWYHNGVLIAGANNLTQIDPNTFGEYYAVVYNDNLCFTQTNSVFISPLGCDSPCDIDASMPTISSSQIDCNSFTASVPNIPSPLPDNIHWSVSGGGTITYQDDLTCSFNFTAPGHHILFYEATYHEDGNTCVKASRRNIIIPYKANMKYTVDCTSTPNVYEVNLLNHSVILSGYDVENYQYFYNGSWHNNGTNPNVAINLSPGLHNVGIRITRIGFPPCEYFTTIDLPNYPTANFTYTSSTCPNEPIQFTALDTDAGNTYLWDFGDGSQNFQQNPVKEYQNSSNAPLPREVTLTVTNRVGCSTTFSPAGTNDISVYGVNMSGTIGSNPLSARVCEGLSVLLNFTSSGSQTPISYEWYREDELMATTSTPTYAATESGTYWVQAINANGCKKSIFAGIIVTVIPTPDVEIRGATSVCVNSTFKLDGTIGGSSVLYSWTLNGNPISNASSITPSLSVPGTYVYGLEIKIPNGSGGYCGSTTTHTITVLDTPAIPNIQIINVQCNPYRVKLKADSGEPGHYSWSNGISDATVGDGSQTFSSGGPIRVRFTNEAGCSVTADFDVPKHPSFYSWVFPKGCYEFCNQDFDNRYLIGPLQLMPTWAWLIDSVVVNNGINTEVENLPIIHSGTYQLSLGNGLCPAITTPPLSINVLPNCMKCSVTIETVDVELIDDGSGVVSYIVKLNITSLYSGVYATLHNLSGGGSFIPSAITLASGVNPFTFVFVAPAGFSGGVLNFYLSIDNNNIMCDEPFEIDFPFVNFEAKFAQNKLSKTESFVVAVPNPSSSATTLYYDFVTTSSAVQKIAVYDLTGRKVFETTCSSKGTQTMDFNAFPSGIYSIQLFDGDHKALQTKFIKQ